MTLRIESHIEGSKTVLTIAGRLTGTGVRELQKVCGPIGQAPALDLAGLISADEQGREALRELIERGSELRGASPFIRLLLDDGECSSDVDGGVKETSVDN